MKSRIMNFEEISIIHTKRWVDEITGKKRQKTKKFWMTLNPFNKNPDGSARTSRDIYRELDKKKKEWEILPEK